MVTVETAFSWIFASILGSIVLWALSLLILWGGCYNTAQATARQEARGDAKAVEQIVDGAPKGSKVKISRKEKEITVVVTLNRHPGADWLPMVPLEAKAVVLDEG
ncbi:MAG: hypothetical protein LBR21_04870 [Propionibacteriaceae bacterium]|nr:hypothetical protein [Propionibacteriaceae bacterium]